MRAPILKYAIIPLIMADIDGVTERPVRLSLKQKVFLENFLLSFNASDAARRAGYSKESHARAYELVNSKGIQKELSRRLSYLGVSGNETIIHISKIARGNLKHFYHDGEFDLESEEAKLNFDTIKKIKQEETIRTDKDGNEIKTVKTEIELYDKLAALTVLAKHHGLLSSDIVPGATTNNTLVIQNLDQAQELGLDTNKIRAELQKLIGAQSKPGANIVDADTVDIEPDNIEPVEPE